MEIAEIIDMADKRRVKQLLAKKLSGKEVAQLVLQTYADEALGKERTFMEVELGRAKSALQGRPGEIDAFNSWMDAARIVDYTKAEARIANLMAQNTIRANLIILHQTITGFLERLHMSALPVVMTEKQAKQYAKSKKCHCRRVAIIQDPDPDDLDWRGNFKASEPNKRLEAICDLFETGKGQDLIGMNLQRIKDLVKEYLAKKTVIEAFCESLGVDFTLQLDDWLDDLRAQVEEYNKIVDLVYVVQTSKEGRNPDKPRIRPPKINIDKLKPAKAAIREIEERLDSSPGIRWFDESASHLRKSQEEEEARGTEA